MQCKFTCSARMQKCLKRIKNTIASAERKVYARDRSVKHRITLSRIVIIVLLIK